jgi:hypothetical protein
MNIKNKPIGFAIKGMKIEQFALFEENYSSKKETELGTELQFKIDVESKQIGIFLGFEFFQGKKIIIKLRTSCHFSIEESAWNSFISENKIIVPKEFLAHLSMITTGTTRGILFTKTESTAFSKFIIPTLNVAEMITQNAEFVFR